MEELPRYIGFWAISPVLYDIFPTDLIDVVLLERTEADRESEMHDEDDKVNFHRMQTLKK